MKACWKDDEDMCEKVAVLEAEIERLNKENAGLKEYSESRDESIKVYREEIKECKEACSKLRYMYDTLFQENTKLREALREIMLLHDPLTEAHRIARAALGDVYEHARLSDTGLLDEIAKRKEALTKELKIENTQLKWQVEHLSEDHAKQWNRAEELKERLKGIEEAADALDNTPLDNINLRLEKILLLKRAIKKECEVKE